MTKFFKRTVVWYLLGSSVPLFQAQTDQPVRRPPPGFYTVQPFTEEQKVTKIRIYPDGTSTSPTETIYFTAKDSQRRMFFSETQLATGRRSFSFDDPIAGEKIIWNTNFPIAKMLKYPTPAEGRKSCWKLPPETLDLRNGEPQIGLSRITCPPAGTHNLPYCDKQPEASGPPVDNSPPAMATFESCARGLASMITPGEKKIEDLGEQLSLGRAAYGCRRTSETPDGISIYEMWQLRVGTEKRSLGLPARTITDAPLAGGARIRTTWNLTLLTLSEPDPRLFQPPQGYELKIYEMSEIPCDASQTTPEAAH